MKLLTEKSNYLLETFQKSFDIMDSFDLWFKINRFFNIKTEILSYTKKKKNYIFYIDKNKVENHISIYSAIDKDWSKWIIIEHIIWNSNKKDIYFVENEKIYNITENKWGQFLKSSILENKDKIEKILDIFWEDINHIFEITMKYKNKLRIKKALNKQISQEIIDKYKNSFLQTKLITI